MSKLVLTDGRELNILSASEDIKFSLNEHGTVTRSRQFIVRLENPGSLISLEQLIDGNTSILRVMNNAGVLVYEGETFMRLTAISRHIGDTAARVDLIFTE